jgi:Fic family protein
MEDTARWEQEENRERYRQQAFISWQSYNLLSSMFNRDAEPLTFSEYLNLLGLGEKTAAHRLEENVTKEQAIEKAKSILMLLKDGESHD